MVFRGGRAIPVVAGHSVFYAAPVKDPLGVRIVLHGTALHNRGVVRRHEALGSAVIVAQKKRVASVPIVSARRVQAAPPLVSDDWWWLLLPLILVAALLGQISAKRTLRGG